MNNQNEKLKADVLRLTKEQTKPLALAVKQAADSPGSGIRKREHLFFQIEPFAREFSEYYYRDPKDRQDSYGYSVNYYLSAIQDRATEKYRASVFAWLSYYHPEKADAFCVDVGARIAGYVGDPIREGCNAGAREWFRQRETEPTLLHGPDETNETEPISEPVVEETPSTVSESEVAPISPSTPAPTPEPIVETVEVMTEKTKQKGRKIGVAILLIFGVAIIGGIAYFGGDVFNAPKAETEITDKSPTQAGTATTAIPKDDEVEIGDASEKEAEKSPVIQNMTDTKPTPAPKRSTVDPVWNKITDNEWSKMTLEYFYSFVSRSNKQDLLNAASSGNADAQTLAGIGYHKGLLGKIDHGLELRKYLEPACRSGQGRACTLIGVHYRFGWGYPANNTTAASFYSKGCRLGNSAGCNYEAVRYDLGQGVPQDVGRAVSTHQKNCDAGMGYSCINLAEAYIYGRGVKQNIPRARELWTKGQKLILPSTYPDIDQVYTFKK